MGGGPGRGGYPHQGGRGRGYSQSGYQGGQMPYSPGPNFRQTPNQPRGGPNMGPQFHGPNQGRPMPPFPNSPHQANRSPALANAHPTTPQMNQVPMAHPQMPPQPYPGYGQHMGPQTVRNPPYSHPNKPARRGNYRNQRGHGNNQSQSSHRGNRGDYGSFGRPRGNSRPPAVPPSVPMPLPDLAPESGQFEQCLTWVKNNQGYPPSYDPNYGFYPGGYNMQNMQYMTPPSPQPRPGMPYNPQAPYIQQQYPVQPPPQSTALSRTPSQVSTDRPGSSLGQPAPAGAPGAGHTHTGSRSSNSPVPAKPHFVIPSAKKSPIIIKDPNSGSVKTFDKNPASPARATPSPVKIATPTATPPPRTSSAADHSRTDSKASSAKTDEEKKQELKDAVRQKIQDDEAAQKRKAEEAARKSAEEAKAAEVKPAETKPVEAKPIEAKPIEAKPVEAKPVEAKKEDATESARAALEDLSLKEKAAPAEEPKKAPTPTPAPAPAPPVEEDEIDYDAIEREMAEIEAKERAAEEDYKRKKQAQKEEAERKEREEREQYEINMKKAEQEAEERELAREAARAKGDNTEDEASRKEREDLFASLKKGGFTATEASTPADSGAATPVSSDISMGPPAKPASAAAAKKPAGLKLDTPKPTEPPQPSAAMKSLQNAKFLEDLSKITYPSSVNAPDASLNANSPAGRRFHYDRDFLLQFQAAFKDKISIDWDARVRETVGDSDASSRPQSARTPSMGGRNPSHKGLGGFPGASMGNFGQPTRHSMPAVNPSLGGRGAHPFGSFGRPGMPGMGAPISRNNSSNMPMSPRVASSKGGAGSKRGKHGAKKEEDSNKAMPLTAGMELKALQQSATGWKPRSIGANATAGPAPGGEGHMAPDVVQRKVKAALNKMTPEKFDRISSQILEIVSQSKDESDGRTLRQVIQLTFEKATDEAHWAPMYAKFCKSMLESMSVEIKDENIRDRNGNIGKFQVHSYLFNAFKILIPFSNSHWWFSVPQVPAQPLSGGVRAWLEG